MKKLLFIDTETTGTEERDRLIQVAYKIEDRTENQMFKAEVPINKVAMSIHHVTDKIVAGKPTFVGSPAYNDLKSLSEDEDVIFVAHNAKFDLGMLAKEGIVFPQYICTYKIAYALQDEAMANHQLQYLRYYYDLEVDTGELSAHDALADIIVLDAVFMKLYEEVEKKTKEDILAKMIDISSKPLLYQKINFGKYRGFNIKDIAVRDRQYLMWLLEQKISEPKEQQDENWIYTLNYYLKR